MTFKRLLAALALAAAVAGGVAASVCHDMVAPQAAGAVTSADVCHDI